MQTIRIHFEDLSTVDFSGSDSQMEEFHKWLRFANHEDVFMLPETEQKIKRGDIARIETV